MNDLDGLNFGVSSDPRAAEEKERLEIDRDEKRRKIKKRLLIIIPAALAIILLIATIPSFLAKKDDYADAVRLLEAGKYDEAKAAFEELGDYSDAKDQALYNVEYCRALSLIQEGDEMIEKNGEEAIELYESALEILKSLKGYADSEEQIVAIDERIAAYDESVRKDSYAEAMKLLEDSKFVSARAAFVKLGNYSDSREMVKECFYRRAMKLVDYIKNNEVRNVYANPTFDDEDYDIEVTKYPVLKMRPICEVAAEELHALEDYKDCKELAAMCEDKGNFKKEFLDYCANGQIAEAAEWLGKYDDVFDEREPYAAIISQFGKYCTSWELYKGDLTLLPLSAGVNAKCVYFTTTIKIVDGVCTLVVTGTDAEFKLEMSPTDNGSGFVLSPGDGTSYFLTINNQNRLTYSHLSDSGKTLGACEYDLSE